MARPVTRRALVVGIGSGSPGQLTGDAVAALRSVDVFVVADKREATRDLVELRAELCRQVVPAGGYRFVAVPDPERGPDRGRSAEQYRRGVTDWHSARADRYRDLLRSELDDDGTAGFLVWGDPAFYDSTLRILAEVRAGGLDLTVEVVPGISSLQLLAARHGIVLHGIGRPLHVTTGRRLVEEYDPALGDVAVMLDGDLACSALVGRRPPLDIYWGAQLGLPDEALVAGPLDEVVEEVQRTRAAVRTRRGWVLDTYLLRPAGTS